MGTMTVPASMEYLDKVMAEVEEALMKAGCGEDEKRLIEISEIGRASCRERV